MESKPLLKVISPVDLRDLPSNTVFRGEVQLYQELQVEQTEQQEELQAEQIQQKELQKEVENSTIDFQESFMSEGLLKQLHFLSRPFQQKLYQPLEIHLQNGTQLLGKIGNIQGAKIQIITNEEEVLVNGNEIAGLYWQKRPFPQI